MGQHPNERKQERARLQPNQRRKRTHHAAELLGEIGHFALALLLLGRLAFGSASLEPETDSKNM